VLWPNGEDGFFDPEALGATYIVSRGGGALITNKEWALWHLSPGSKRDEMRTGVPGLFKVFCAYRTRIGAALIFAAPFVPYKFRVEGLPQGLYLVHNMRPTRTPRAQAP